MQLRPVLGKLFRVQGPMDDDSRGERGDQRRGRSQASLVRFLETDTKLFEAPSGLFAKG
jgi:hypothetical protein